MEPPAGSRFADGVWHYDPHVPPMPMVRLTHSIHAAGYDICMSAGCRRSRRRRLVPATAMAT